jgi:hypothetical protein
MLRRDAERSDRLEVDVVTFTATSHKKRKHPHALIPGSISQGGEGNRSQGR